MVYVILKGASFINTLFYPVTLLSKSTHSLRHHWSVALLSIKVVEDGQQVLPDLLFFYVSAYAKKHIWISFFL